MGVKLGKISDALTNFEVTGHEVSYDHFKSKSRSISKSLQSFMFREKAIIDYGFDFQAEATWRVLDNLIRNRNSNKPGLATIPIPYGDSAESDIDFIGINNPSSTHTIKFIDKIVGGDPTLLPIPSEFLTEISNANYDLIDQFDSSVWTETVTDQLFALFTFDLTAFITAFSSLEIRRLTFAFFGINASPIRFYVFDHVANDWFNIIDYDFFDDTQFPVNDFQMIAPISAPYGVDSVAENFLSSSKVDIMVEFPKGTDIFAQYVRLFVNGYFVMADTPQSYNFSDSFIGAGRTFGISLLEV